MIPTLVFGILAVFYACMQLRRPTIDLLKEKVQYAMKPVKKKEEANAPEEPFLKDM